MNVQAAYQPSAFAAGQVPARPAFAVEDIVLRHLSTRSEIEGITHLRDGIDLSVHAVRPDFALLEKKETNSESSTDSI